MKVLELGERLISDAADPLHQSLQKLRGSSLQIDAEKVKSLGTLCGQVLVAASTCWSRDGTDFSIKASEEFKEDARLLGMKFQYLANR